MGPSLRQTFSKNLAGSRIKPQVNVYPGCEACAECDGTSHATKEKWRIPFIQKLLATRWQMKLSLEETEAFDSGLLILCVVAEWFMWPFSDYVIM